MAEENMIMNDNGNSGDIIDMNPDNVNKENDNPNKILSQNSINECNDINMVVSQNDDLNSYNNNGAAAGITAAECLDEINQFLSDIKFKSQLFGANVKEVENCIKDLDYMYRNKVTELRESYQQNVSAIEAELANIRSAYNDGQTIITTQKQELAKKEEELLEAREKARAQEEKIQEQCKKIEDLSDEILAKEEAENEIDKKYEELEELLKKREDKIQDLMLEIWDLKNVSTLNGEKNDFGPEDFGHGYPDVEIAEDGNITEEEDADKEDDKDYSGSIHVDDSRESIKNNQGHILRRRKRKKMTFWRWILFKFDKFIRRFLYE